MLLRGNMFGLQLWMMRVSLTNYFMDQNSNLSISDHQVFLSISSHIFIRIGLSYVCESFYIPRHQCSLQVVEHFVVTQVVERVVALVHLPDSLGSSKKIIRLLILPREVIIQPLPIVRSYQSAMGSTLTLWIILHLYPGFPSGVGMQTRF